MFFVLVLLVLDLLVLLALAFVVLLVFLFLFFFLCAQLLHMHSFFLPSFLSSVLLRLLFLQYLHWFIGTHSHYLHVTEHSQFVASASSNIVLSVFVLSVSSSPPRSPQPPPQLPTLFSFVLGVSPSIVIFSKKRTQDHALLLFFQFLLPLFFFFLTAIS